MVRKVCIAVDASQTSQNALRWAARSVVNPGDQVALFTVLHPSPESEMQAGVGTTAGGSRTALILSKPEADPKEAAQAQALLDRCKGAAVSEGVAAEAVETHALVAALGTSADVGRELTRTAEECGCESLVMGSRGLGLSKKALLGLMGVGSVSEYVMRHAPCNVVLYKDKAQQS